MAKFLSLIYFLTPSMGIAQMPEELRTNRTLVELIEALPKPLPSSAIKIEETLGISMKVDKENRYWTFYTTRPIVTSDGYHIIEVDIRLPTAETLHSIPGSGAFLALSIDTDSCVPPEPLRAMFGLSEPAGLVIDNPSAQYFSAPVPWGRFSMGVRTLKPGVECVYSVVVNNSRPG